MCPPPVCLGCDGGQHPHFAPLFLPILELSVSRIRGSARLPSVSIPPPCRSLTISNGPVPAKNPRQDRKSSYRPKQAYQRASFDCTHARSQRYHASSAQAAAKANATSGRSSLHQDRVINQSIAFVGTRCSHFAVWLLRVRRIRQSYDTSPPSRHRLAASAHHPVVLSDAQTSVNTLARYRRTARPKKYCPVSTGNGQVCQQRLFPDFPTSKHASSANRIGA